MRRRFWYYIVMATYCVSIEFDVQADTQSEAFDRMAAWVSENQGAIGRVAGAYTIGEPELVPDELLEERYAPE